MMMVQDVVLLTDMGSWCVTGGGENTRVNQDGDLKLGGKALVRASQT